MRRSGRTLSDQGTLGSAATAGCLSRPERTAASVYVVVLASPCHHDHLRTTGEPRCSSHP